MPTGGTAVVRGKGGQAVAVIGAGSQDLGRGIEPFDQEGIWFLLGPFEAAFLSIETDLKGILLAGRDLGGKEDAGGAIVKTEQHVAIVIEGPSFHKDTEVGTELFDLEAADIFRQVCGVGTDIAHATGLARAPGIGAPFGLFATVLFRKPAEPALGVFHVYLADLSE